MYGLIHRLLAHPGQRDSLAAVVTEGARPPGCRSFVVAYDPGHPDALWITEVWDSEAAWRRALDGPETRERIARTQALVSSFDAPATTRPILVFP